MSRLRVRKGMRAKSDIDDIVDWIAQSSGSVDAALRWLNALEEKFEKLADAPGTGTARPELGRGLRSSPFGNYLVFFQSTSRVLRIVRVIHGARDYTRGIEFD